MKSFRWKIALCVVPVLLAAAVVAMAWVNYQKGRGGFKLGVDLAGGTILVYEVADDQKDYDINEIAAALKKRIDPADLYNVTIRPVGQNRIEIIIPTGSRNQVKAENEVWQEFLKKVADRWAPKTPGGYDDIPRGQTAEVIKRINEAHKVPPKEIQDFIAANYQDKFTRRELTSEEVERIKELISRQGLLEFRILANNQDDKEAIDAARKYFDEAKSNKPLQNELQLLAAQGKPPPPPQNPQGGTGFPAKDTTHTYAWVELGPDERASLNLDNAAETDASRNGQWKRLAEARQSGEAILLPDRPSERGTVVLGGLIYSRPYSVNPAPAKDRDKKYEYFFLTRESEPGKAVTGDYLEVGRISSGQDAKFQPEVRFGFNARGGKLFWDLTSKNTPSDGVSRSLAVIMDNQIVSAPSLNQAISDSGVITGIRSKEEVDNLVRILRSGRLPATLKQRPVSENTIGSTLGEDTIRSGFLAVVLSFVAVMAFMVIYYRFAGTVACIALLANLLLTVAFMVLVNATFTLPGLAGLVLMLGMAVDANVLIYERVREERDRGASLALAIRNGYDRAFPTIIDTHLTSIFTAIVLYAVGNDQLKGFGISLTVGLIISLFTSLYMTRVYFDLALAKNMLTKLSMMRLFTRPNINFMGIRYVAFTVTIVVAVVGVALFLFRGERGLNIDFVGGTAYTGQLAKMEDLQTLRGLLDKHKERLKIIEGEDGVRQIAPDTFEVTYDDGDGKKDVRVIHVDRSAINPDKPPTVDEIRERASELPEYSVQMIFLNSEEFSKDDKSRMFTVLTTERAPELVQTAVSRLLKDVLRDVQVVYEITGKPDDKLVRTARLKFQDRGSKEEAYASPARIGAMLTAEVQAEKLSEVGRKVLVDGKGTQKEGLFAEMEVTLPDAVSRPQMEKALAGLQKRFADSPQPERLENFDSQLATETRLRALYAVLASWGAILLYLWFRFGNWTFGLAAVICLIHDLCITLGAIALCHYIDRYVPWLAGPLLLHDFKLDLAAVASLLTLVGFSVNDTIVVFDRIREVRGKNPALTPQTINDSVNQTLSRTLLTSLTVWLVVIVLYISGGPGVHLFAFVMVVGVIVGTFSSIYVASPLLLILGEGQQPATVRDRQVQPAGTPA